MPSRNAELLMDRWINDLSFREALRKDAASAVARVGIHLDDEEMAALQALDWSLTDEELVSRANAFA